MNPHEDAPALLRQATDRLEADAPDLDFDLIVREGYRVRRRRYAALGGTVGAGVAAMAAVLALSLAGLLTGADSPPAGGGGVEDPETAGYPYEPDEEFGTDEERAQLNDAAAVAFGSLLAEAGLTAEGEDPTFDFGSVQTPGNYGQTWLRSFASQVWPEGGQAPEDTVLRIEALLPGGWTPEPGPATEQVFPQHLISASGAPWYDGADWTDELTTTGLDDGRTLYTVDHECAYEAAVAYPNGTGLRVAWDMGCHEPAPEYAIAMEDFTAAVAAMPEFDFDTTGLAPVGDLLDVPVGWTYDPAWEDAAQADAVATMDAARAALTGAHPGGHLDPGTAEQQGETDYGALVTRIYAASGQYAAEGGDIEFDLSYYLPGGWIPGVADPVERGPFPIVCPEDFTCTQTTDDDGTLWVFAEGPASAENRLEIVRFDPDGWAVGASARADAPIDADTLGDLLRSMPAPVYDADAAPTIPSD